MQTSAIEPSARELTLLVMLASPAAIDRWLLIDGDGVIERGEAALGLPVGQSRAILAVPGEEVAIHWIDLPEGLTRAQAAAAARLMLADAAAEPIATLHVAVGRPESGRTPVAFVSASRMESWLGAALDMGIDPAAMIPTSMLIEPPGDGLARSERDGIADYRGVAIAFSAEPGIATMLAGEAPVHELAEPQREAGLAGLLGDPVLDLRQGRFARRRAWRVERKRVRRIAVLVLLLCVLTLAVQLGRTLAYSFAAERAREEAAALLADRGGANAARPDFGSLAGLLADSVRVVPGLELTALDFRRDGSLSATVTADDDTALAVLARALDGNGLAVTIGTPRGSAGRRVADMELRAR